MVNILWYKSRGEKLYTPTPKTSIIAPKIRCERLMICGNSAVLYKQR